MADRLLPHVQAYENSGLARFGIGQGYRPDPYVPQNFAPPALAPKKFFGADLPGTPGVVPEQEMGMPIQQAGNGAAGPNGEGQNPEGMPGMAPSPGQMAAAVTSPIGLAMTIGQMMSQPSLMGPVAPTPSQLAQQNVDAQLAQDAQNSQNTLADSQAQSQDNEGGSGGGGGGKIICTAMNDLYGLPYRENKVWIAYAAQRLTPEHQVGYHRVFKPLVKYAYKSGDGWTNRVLRSLLHWMAVERTRDLQDEIAGKNPRPIQRALLRKPAETLMAWVGRK